MKRYCKNMDILDIDFLKICVRECLRKKWKRRDVLEYFSGLTARSEKEVLELIQHGEKEKLIGIAAHVLQRQLINRKIKFVPIWYKEKVDSSNNKIRRIGIQHISQQLYDYVAVRGLADLLKRIGEYQCASIPGRGQTYGMQHIRKWLKEPDVKYVAQLDVKKCFQSIPQDKLLIFIDKYVNNDNLKWLVHELVQTFETGISIGSYLSQYLCNLYMSQLYHEISERMYFERRGKKIKYVKHVLFYMDDINLFGCSAKSMHKAVDKIISYARYELGLEIKPTWNVRKLLDADFIDTMGFRIYRDRVTIRQRVFLRIRRAYKALTKRKYQFPSVKQAKRCASYYGFIKNTNSMKFAKKYRVYKSIRASKEVVSYESKFRCRAA